HLFCSRVRTMHGARLFDLRSRRFHVFDFEAEVVDAGPPERTLCLGGLVVFELEDSEIYVAVAQVVALGSWGVNFTYLLQTEALDVKLCRRFHVSRGDRDVPNSCHCLPPFFVSSLAPLEKWLPESITVFERRVSDEALLCQLEIGLQARDRNCLRLLRFFR